MVFLHGGPGAGAIPAHRRFFDPAHYRIVIFDQRGAGRSTPVGELRDNTTPHLIADMERIRTMLNIDRWLLFGGSWGSTLALAYAETHPDRVLGMVLRGIFLGSEPEIRWFLYGIRNVFPEAWGALTEILDEAERSDILAAYHRRLSSRDPAVLLPAARAWSRYEGACSTFLPSPETIAAFGEDSMAVGLARIEAHYFVNRVFRRARRPARRRRSDPPFAGRDRAGPVRHGVPDRHRRCAPPRLARGRVCDRSRFRPFGDGSGHLRGAGRRDGAPQDPARLPGVRSPPGVELPEASRHTPARAGCLTAGECET